MLPGTTADRARGLMSTKAASWPAQALEDPAAQWRLKSRLAVAFLLDVIGIVRGDGHILDTLLVSAVIQANVQEISRRADLQVAFALSDQLPPDELRRPVSMNAIASSLDLPFETVRRRLNRLVREGYCTAVSGGLIVPSAVLNRPKYYVDGLRGFERLRAFYYQLSDLGLLPELPRSSVRLSPETFPVRVVSRLVGTYVLRVVEAVGVAVDLLDGLILLEAHRSNTEGLALDADAAPIPISVARLAARIGAPAETVRRHAADLTERGLCLRVRGGLVVPPEALFGPLRPALEVNVGDLQRLFAALAELGVLQVWDNARPAA